MKKFVEHEKVSLGISKVLPEMAISFDYSTKSTKAPNQPSVARLTGGFFYKKELITPVKGGVFGRAHIQLLQWDLRAGELYEYRNFLLESHWGRLRSGYFAVGIGFVIDLSEEDMEMIRKKDDRRHQWLFSNTVRGDRGEKTVK